MCTEPRQLEVVARPHPFSLQTERMQFQVGLTLLQIVGPLAVAVHIEIGGMTIPEEMWVHVRPKVGCAVVITRYPQGGSAKSIFRLIAFAALAVGVALISGGALSGLSGFFAHLGITASFAAGSLSAGLLAAGIGLVGSLLVNALIPPSNPGSLGAGESTNLLKGITGTSNQVNRYGTIPCVVGTIKYFPTYAALPWTEVLGDEQYLRCLFDLGYGDPNPADMKIGDTDLAEYTDVETQIGTNPSLFSQDIIEEPINLPFVGTSEPHAQTRTTGTGADEASLDLAWSSGLFGVNSDGHTTTVTVTNRVEFRLTGTSGAWTSVGSAPSVTLSTPAATFSSGNLLVKNSERKAVRVGVRWMFPTAGQYDVRVTRTSTDWGGASTDSRVGDMVWTVLRTIRYTSPSNTGTKKIALRIKATDQLSGNISQFNCILSQPVPVWHPTTSTWVTEYSQNPAWIFRWILTGCPANPRTVSTDRVNDDALKAWAVECDEKDFTYSASLGATTVYALLKEIAAAGRASFDIRDTKYSVIRDEPQTTPVQVFTPRNSWGFGGNRAFPDAVHALRVQFVNPEADWQQDERVVYDDGYGDAAAVAADTTGMTALATKFEQLTINGCVDADGAWRLGRYHLAVSRLRPNTYHWSADVENLVCNRGDLVLVANDVIGVGVSWGKIKQVIGNPATALVLDEAVSAEAGKSYAVRLRRQDATVVLTQCTLSATDVELHQVTLTTPTSGLNEDDLFCFGELDHDTIPLIITNITPGADFSAQMSAVDAAPAVLNADAGTPPAWSSQITGQPWLEPPPEPEIQDVSSNQLLSGVDDGGYTTVVLQVTLSSPSSGKVRVDHSEIRYRRSDTVGAWTNVSLAAGETGISLGGGFDRGAEYQIEARNVGVNGAASEWVQVLHTVEGVSVGPLSVATLLAYQAYYGIRLTWTVSGTQRPDAVYEVQRTGDSSGSPDEASWVQVALISALTFTDAVPDASLTYWYRVRASSAGLTSAWALAVSQTPFVPSAPATPGDPEPTPEPDPIHGGHYDGL